MKPGFQIEPFPEMRRMAPDIGWLTRGRYTIRGLLEIDVTRPRQLIREHKARSGEALSFTAFLAACTGRAVDADRRVQAMRNWRGSLVIFDEVDFWIVSKSPQMRKQNLGTVTLSAVGMFGNKAGWAIGPNFHPLGLIVGSIAEKPAWSRGASRRGITCT